MNRNTFFRAAAVLVALALAGIAATMASARSSAVPAQTSSPTLQGPATQPFVGDKLTVTNGTWSGSPTKFSYQWDRCDPTGDRQNCVAITGATPQSYTATTADVNHTLHANVFATNADGIGKADTKGSGVVAARGAPKNTTRPTISGKAVVGETLTATNGTLDRCEHVLVPVAAVRPEREQLRRHRRCDRLDVRRPLDRRRPRASRPREGDEQVRLDDRRHGSHGAGHADRPDDHDGRHGPGQSAADDHVRLAQARRRSGSTHASVPATTRAAGSRSPSATPRRGRSPTRATSP